MSALSAYCRGRWVFTTEISRTKPKLDQAWIAWLCRLYIIWPLQAWDSAEKQHLHAYTIIYHLIFHTSINFHPISWCAQISWIFEKCNLINYQAMSYFNLFIYIYDYICLYVDVFGHICALDRFALSSSFPAQMLAWGHTGASSASWSCTCRQPQTGSGMFLMCLRCFESFWFLYTFWNGLYKIV